MFLVSGLLFSCQPSQVVGYGEFDPDAPPPEVYETLELSFADNETSGNRFTTYAQVTFSRGLESYLVDGFYDGSDPEGNHIWRARFMPNRSGRWRYRWEFNESSGSGEIYVRERRDPENHGHVRVDKTTPSMLLHDDGTSHYWFGGKSFSAKNYGPMSKGGESNDRSEGGSRHDDHYTDQQFGSYLDLLESTRHNGTLLKIGQYPLENDLLSWDLDWVQRADAWVQELQRRNIYCQINLFDPRSRTDDSWFDYSEHPSEHLINAWGDADNAAKQNYIRYIVARFASYSNVYWELVDRIDFAGVELGDRFVQQANENYLPWLRAADPYDLPVGGSDVNRAREMPDLDIEFPRQSTPPVSDSRRAVVLNELVHACDGPDGTTAPAHRDEMIRQSTNRVCYRSAIWSAFVLGTSGASEASWLDLTKPLNDAVRDVMHDHQRLHDFVDSLQTELKELVRNAGFVEQGSGQVGTRAKLGHTYVSYFGGPRDVELIRVRLPPGQYRYGWLYPKYEETSFDLSHEVAVTTAYAPTELFRPAFEEDLVLLMQRQ